MEDVFKDLVFGPHNTTTILVLSLLAMYSGALVPRPTHKRAQDLVDSKRKTIDMLLVEYRDGIKDIREHLDEIDVSVSQMREDIKDVGRKVEANGCTNSCDGEGRNDGLT